MAEISNMQFAQANTTAQTVQTTQASREWQDNIGEGLKVTATGVGVVFAVLVIMIIFINLFKFLEKRVDAFANFFSRKQPVESTQADEQTIDNTTLVLISAAVAAYTHNKAKVRRVRVLPSKAKQGGNWAMQARSALQASHSGKK